MLARSIRDILIDLASFIATPEGHLQERRVAPTAESEVGPGGLFPPTVRILSGAEKPTDAFWRFPTGATGIGSTEVLLCHDQALAMTRGLLHIRYRSPSSRSVVKPPVEPARGRAA